MRAEAPPIPPASPLSAWTLVCCALALTATCGLYWAFGGRAFADFATYADIADELGARGADLSVFGPEGMSRGLLQLFRLVFGAGDYAAQAMALVCQALLVFGVAVAARRRAVLPANLLLAIGLFAPLLALITLRATPAYLLCAFAIARARLAERPRMWEVAAAAAVALLFHLSAVFVLLGVMAATAVPSRVPRGTFFGLAAAAGAVALAARQSFDIGTVLTFAGGAAVIANPLVADRIAYLTDLAAPVSASHLAYFAFASVLVYRIIFTGPPHPSDRLVLSLFVLYCACLVSPVVAFRNSYYVLIPLVVTARRPVLPFGDALIGQALNATVCAGLLAFSIRGVLQPS